ncbi:MAG: Gfo/Idh/MocA family oxidoreductase [Lachnospiraceae bacterium]|jgi:1,5-anhydro-D-fructose reductase (1,5-anhydro-D-mannitol-forming)|nr:Gfo/Idh/MocA family oxidoreductase [Lachnospiraceae bacterium]
MKIAIISFWHVHARSYVQEALTIPGVEIAAVWDEDPQRGRKWAQELACPYEKDYAAILENEEIEGVLLCAPTAMHAELLLQAAQAGKHIFTEKVLTLTLAQAQAVQRAVRENQVRFAISFPHKTRRDLLFVKKLVEDGALGRLTYARVHNCHNGSSADWLPASFYDPAQSGGGAMIDLGAHGLYLLPWFLGEAQTVQSTFTQAESRGVEDNAVSVFTFAQGAIGVAETGFVQRYDPMTVEVVGTEGAVFVRAGEAVRLCNAATDGKWCSIEEDQLPKGLPSALQQWVNAVELHMGTLCDIEEAVSLTRLMEAAYRSAQLGQAVKL